MAESFRVVSFNDPDIRVYMSLSCHSQLEQFLIKLKLSIMIRSRYYSSNSLEIWSN